LIAFGGIFIGLDMITRAFSGNEAITDFFVGLFSRFDFWLLLILLGMAFTIVIQSSSASMAIYISLLSGGILPFSSAVFLIFGSEIGTCLTSILASLKANTNAKRAAAVHLIFNVLSAVIFTIIYFLFGNLLLPFYTNLITTPAWQLSIFQVIYNVVSALILIWFIKPLNWFVCKIIRDNKINKKIKSPKLLP